VYVPVLCEPFMLARVTGYRAYVRCSLPTAGAASNLCLASRAAFPVAGVKADAGYGFLWPLGRARRRRVLDDSRAALLAVFLDVQRSTTQRCRGICADFTRCCLPRLLKMPAASLAQE
jgi:hypothetical protein